MSVSGDIACRGFLRAMGATIIVVGGINALAEAEGAAERLRLSHAHLDSRFPVSPNAKLRPPDATVDAYRLF